MARHYAGYENGKPKAEGSQARVRPCLCCGVDFHSEHFGNRMCGVCRSREVDASAHPIYLWRRDDER